METSTRYPDVNWAHRHGRDTYGIWVEVDIIGVTLKMRWIEPGKFLFGPTIEMDKKLHCFEEPAQEVIITEGYWIAEMPCTQALWTSIIDHNPSITSGKTLPVYNVSWRDIENFLWHLNRLMPALQLKVPTEAQWEYACKAGSNEDLTWYHREVTEPNTWGVYYGRRGLKEWCDDWYEERYDSRQVLDPARPPEGKHRVARSAIYDSDHRCGLRNGQQMRLAYRGAFDPLEYSMLGFRLSRALAVPKLNNTSYYTFIFSEEPSGVKLNTIKKPTWASNLKQDNFGLSTEVYVDDSVSFTLRWINPGSFIMGMPFETYTHLLDDYEEQEDEAELHKVLLTRGFWLAETPCTQALWTTIMGKNPSHFKGPNRPVEKVSWQNVESFMKKLNERIPKLNACLPTEAQWEYACRAGCQEAIYADADQIAWHANNSRRRTHNVGLKLPNAWGLYDTIGNVWEFCHDWFSLYNCKQVIDPIGPENGTFKISRGGCFGHSPDTFSAGDRYYEKPTFKHKYLGFRIALSGHDVFST